MSKIVKAKPSGKLSETTLEASKKRISKTTSKITEDEEKKSKRKPITKDSKAPTSKGQSQVVQATSQKKLGEKVMTKNSKTPVRAEVKKQSSIEKSTTKVPQKATKIELKTSSKSSSKGGPMKAKPMPGLPKSNVMNQVHNVTVSSPPSQRKVPEETHLPRDRTKTRTLDPDEIVIFKKKPQVNPEPASTTSDEKDSSISEAVSLKPAVAFEVNFEAEKKVKDKKEELKNDKKATSPEEQEYNYEDDFESYESDFESDSPSRSEDESSEEKSDKVEKDSATSSPTTSPEIPQKDEEKKLDSGNYDLQVQRERSPLDNIEEHDSGVTFEEVNLPKEFPKKVIKNTRGEELMKKISLDTMTFSLFELKPIPYEYYMKVYGQGNTTQIYTQTETDEMDQDTQTDETTSENVWTQFPPTFSKDVLSSGMGLSYHEERIGIGRDNKKDFGTISHSNYISSNLIDYENLNYFLQKTAVAVAGVVQKKLEAKTLKSSSIPTSTGFFTLSLDQDIFKRYDVTKIFTDREIANLLITIHQLKHPQEDVFYSNLIGVWNILDSKYPVKILSSWSDISHVLVHKSSPDMIISASLDGSMSLWDVREYLQGQDDEKVLGQAPCQLIIPKIPGNFSEIGRIVSLKCIEWKSESDFFMDFNPIQVCSLHEDGILIIWLLIETSSTEPTLGINASAHDHAFSKAKLVQSNLFDLRPFLMEDRTTKSNFERRLSYFEGDLFSDTALKELQDKDGEKDSNSEILCTDFEALTEGYFVATNRPFLLYFNKSPKKDSIVKIPVEDGDCKLHPTVLQVCPLRENLLIGFSDGSVKLKPIVFESDGAWGGVETKVAEEEVEESNLSAKSCAIQNIVKNERKLYQESQALSNLDSTEMRKTFASHGSLQRKDVRIGGPILGGSYFRRGFVRRIQMTRKHIFALCGNGIKGFNLNDYEEVQMEMENMNIVDIGSTSDGLLKSRLVIATRGEIQIHSFDIC